MHKPKDIFSQNCIPFFWFFRDHCLKLYVQIREIFSRIEAKTSSCLHGNFVPRCCRPLNHRGNWNKRRIEPSSCVRLIFLRHITLEGLTCHNFQMRCFWWQGTSGGKLETFDNPDWQHCCFVRRKWKRQYILQSPSCNYEFVWIGRPTTFFPQAHDVSTAAGSSMPFISSKGFFPAWSVFHAVCRLLGFYPRATSTCDFVVLLLLLGGVLA